LGSGGGSPQSDPLARITGLNSIGGCGVLIFFAISGYWIARSAQISTSWPDFVWRRVLRITPGLWVMLLLTVIVLGPLETTFSLTNYFSQYRTREYLQGFFLHLKDGLPGVFENNPLTATVNGSLWSLRMEVKCYLLISLMVVTPKRARGLVIGFLMLIVLYLSLRHVFGRPFKVPFFRENSALVVNTVTAFFIGAGVFQFKLERWCNVRFSLPVLMFTVIVGSLYPGHRGLSWLFAAGLSIATLSIGFHVTNERLNRWVSGDISYGLYLYAFPIQQTILAHNRFIEPGLLFFYTCLFLFPLALASWQYVEKPMLAERNWFRSKKPAFLALRSGVAR
jgi:peptidoglycan/LPS O-acetylase OafA/YrhL